MNPVNIFHFFAAFILLNACQQQSSSIKEETITLKTYPFGDPDPVARPQNLRYPYFRFDGYEHEGKDSVWNVIVMENPYVKVIIMPDVGGKIWGAVEKTTGEEFIYFNHSVKFRNIAMRGPWTSGGIELNFGIIGHAPTTSTPVDYCIRTNDNGSVSCFIGALELLSETWWQVEINLPGNKAYFTTNTTWHNTSPVQQPYYHWMNAGYKASDDLEFYFPGQYYIGHDGDLHPWPVAENGRQISRYAENNFGSNKSYHVIGELNDFYAAYYHDRDFGSVHYAPYDEKLGMKIWVWGLSRQGMIWEDLLTDTDGQYVELQSGRLYNQASSGSIQSPFKQIAFEPYGTDKWTEYWYPVKNTGGVTRAGTDGAWMLRRETDGTYSLRFCAVRHIDAELVIKSEEKEHYKKVLSLRPMETWSAGSILPKGIDLNDLKITLDGRLVFSGNQPLNRPMKSPDDFDWNSVYGLYLRGQQELNRKYHTFAGKYFIECLSKDSMFIPAINGMATLCFKQDRLDNALSYARKSLSINAYDPDANLLYGLVNSRLGKTVDAKDGFSVAALTASHRTAAYICLAREYAKESDWDRVLLYTQKSLSSGNENADAIQLQAVAYRKTGQQEKARNIIQQLLLTMPLNHYARYEKYRQGGSSEDFKSGIRNELPYQTYIELGCWYEGIGCYSEALELYALANNPVADYHAAYILYSRNQNGESNLLLQKAGETSPAFVFPHRPETLPVLQWAVRQSDKWVHKYYLGILYLALGQVEEGKKLLEDCGNVPDFAPFYLTRAQFRKNDFRLDDLKKVESIEKSWRAGMALIQYYESVNNNKEMYQCADLYRQLFPDNYPIGLKYAASLLNTGQYQRCADYLDNLQVLPNEGAYEGRALYRDAWLSLAMQSINKKDYEKAMQQIEISKEWPENLGVGKPYEKDIDLRSENYLTAYCFYRQGNKAKADEYFDKVIAGKGNNTNELLSALLLKRRGKQKQADQRVNAFVNHSRNKAITAWCEFVYKNNGRIPDTARIVQSGSNVAAWERGGRKDYIFDIVEGILKNCNCK